MSYYVNFLEGLGSNEFHIKCRFGTHGSWKNQNNGGRLGATSWTALPIQPILPDFLANWQCSKMGSRIFIFSLVLGAKYSFYVKSIATYTLQKVDMIIHL